MTQILIDDAVRVRTGPTHDMEGGVKIVVETETEAGDVVEHTISVHPRRGTFNVMSQDIQAVQTARAA